MLKIFKLFHKKSKAEIEIDVFMAQIKAQHNNAIKEIELLNKIMEGLKND